jgi:hypothetical protein
MISQWQQRPIILFTLCAIVIACARTQPEGAASAGNTTSVAPDRTAITTQVIRTDQSIAPGLRAEAECDTPGHGVIRVLWRARDAQAAAAELTGRRVDLTIYPNGFEKGLYVSAPLLEKQTFQPAAGIRTLRNPPRALQVVIQRAPAVAGPGLVAFELTQVEPGMLYSIRVPAQTASGWVASSVVEVMAPICPSDEVRR